MEGQKAGTAAPFLLLRTVPDGHFQHRLEEEEGRVELVDLCVGGGGGMAKQKESQA